MKDRPSEGVIEKWHTEASFVDENPVHMANNRLIATVAVLIYPMQSSAHCKFPARRHLSLSLHPQLALSNPRNYTVSTLADVKASSPSIFRQSKISTYLDSILPLREMRRLLLLLLRHDRRLMPTQSPPDSPSLLRTQIKREIFLLGVEEAQLLSLVGVDDC